MIEITTTIPAATNAVPVGMPTSGAYAVAGSLVHPVATVPSCGAPIVRERRLAPVFAATTGEVRRDDATGFTGTTAWSPPT